MALFIIHYSFEKWIQSRDQKRSQCMVSHMQSCIVAPTLRHFSSFRSFGVMKNCLSCTWKFQFHHGICKGVDKYCWRKKCKANLSQQSIRILLCHFFTDFREVVTFYVAYHLSIHLLYMYSIVLIYCFCFFFFSNYFMICKLPELRHYWPEMQRTIFVPRRNEVAEGGYWITLRPSVSPSVRPSVRPPWINYLFTQNNPPLL